MANRNFVNLNVNPCNQCMPLGAATALKGIEGSIMLLHGSQGCSTYIRRHMAAHYNEPIDIASSSMTEKGTVYGGADNMKKAIKNIIKQYNPKLIGVATTCLAETIGEDIKRISDEFLKENKDFVDVVNLEKIITVKTPGYGGTQYEGFFATIKSLVENLSKKTKKSGKINIIAPSITPAEVREIKRILNLFDLKYILIPDISETLDAPFMDNFNKIPLGGTKLKDIEDMGNSILTIEIGSCIEDSFSTGVLLNKKFNIPLYRIPLPIGYKNTKIFLDLLSKISNKDIPNDLKISQGRYVDAIIDAHKHCAEGKVSIFGEPDLAMGYSEFCIENGIVPLIIASGSSNSKLKSLESIIKNKFGITPSIYDDTDFQTIQEESLKKNVNILIGNSGGKFVSEKIDVPLLRMGFPIHDRIGGQRIMHLFYDGGMRLLDDLVNTLLERKYNLYREKMFNKYYKGVD